MLKALSILTVLACGVAFGAPRETASFTNLDSAIATNGGLGTATFTGTYSPKYITVSGTLATVEGGTYAREAVIQVFTPGGHSFIIQPFDSNGFTTLELAPTMFHIPYDMVAAAGNWSFRCIETFDDGVRNTADASWTVLNIQLNDGPPIARDFGGITSAGLTLGGFTTLPGTVGWFKFSLENSATVAGGTFLDIDTVNSTGDTEIALYRADGALVASDDDDGPGLTSQLTFGAGTRPSAGGNGLPYNGRDGELVFGTYYLAVSSYDSTFADGWNVTAGGANVPDTRVRINSNTGFFSCPADVDDGTGTGAKDGGVTIDDLLYFLQRFEAGC